MNKKGFTIIELLVVVIMLTVIAGLFTINFTHTLNSSREEEFEESLSKIEAAADAYVMTYKEYADEVFEDIRLVAISEDGFCFIPVEEIVKKGFLNHDIKNPTTGEKLSGFVKFSKEKNGNYKFEYYEEIEDHITIVYDKNGADSITRYAQAFICEDYESNADVIECAENIALPSINRSGGMIYGWSTNRDDLNSNYNGGTSLARLLENKNFKVENNKITLYAISSGERRATLVIDENTSSEVSCKIYNFTPNCTVTLPNFTPREYYIPVGWNTNSDKNGDRYGINETITLPTDFTLYAEENLQNFEIYVNKLNRTETRVTIPSNINIVLVLDVSGSMSSNNRLNNLKKVTKGLVERMNLNNSTLSLIAFESSAQIRLKFSQDETSINSAIDILSAGGGTNYGTAIKVANQLMNDRPNDKDTYVIFVSDGVASISEVNENLVELKTKANIYSMGIGLDSGDEYLKIIASNDNNYYSYNDSADDMTLSEFYDLFDDIVRDITVVHGDGLENAVKTQIVDGILNLGELVIAENYKFEIYLGSELITAYTGLNDYFTLKDGEYSFDIEKFALSNDNIGLGNIPNLKIKYFYKEDISEVN